MQMKISQIIIEGVWDREFIEETIESNIIPNVGDYVKIGNIDGKVRDKIIDYNTNEITIRLYPREK